MPIASLAQVEESTTKYLKVSPISNEHSAMTVETAANSTVKISIDGQVVFAQFVADANLFELEFSQFGFSRLAADSIVKVIATDASNRIEERQIVVTNRMPLNVILSKIYDSSTSFTGKTEPYAKVEYELGSRECGVTTADDKGRFYFKLNNEHRASSLWIHVTAVDGLKRENIKFSILGTTKPLLTIEEISNKTTVVKGTTPGERAIKVKLYIYGKEKYSTKSNAFANYSLKIARKKAGTKLRLTATDSSGNITVKNSVVVDRIAPKTPVVNKIDKKTKKVTGRAEKKATVYMYKAERFLGKTTVNATGKFSISLKRQQAGMKLTIYAKDRAKNKSKPLVITVKK